MTKRPTFEQLEKLKAFGSATIHEAQGQKGAFESSMKPLDPTLRLVGRALTVELRPDDNLLIHYAVARAEPGDVLVVDAKGFLEAGPWGDVLTLAAQQRGIAGLVINGAVRDAESIIEMGFPIFCRGLSIKGTAKEQNGKVNAPLYMNGVAINPGDVIVGDRDGLVVVAAAEVADVIAASERRELKEVDMRRAILDGKTTVELLNLKNALEEFGHRL